MVQRDGFECGPKKPIQPLVPGDELPGESTKVPRVWEAIGGARDEAHSIPEVDGPEKTDFEIDSGEARKQVVIIKSGRDSCVNTGIFGQLTGDSGKDPKAKA